jgi:hypothetical protein
VQKTSGPPNPRNRIPVPPCFLLKSPHPTPWIPQESAYRIG